MSELKRRTVTSEKVLSRSLLHSGRAFTLLEMLAVMAIFSLIGLSLFTIFRQGTETWRLSEARTEAYLKGRMILEMMAREIKGAVLITEARGPDSDPDITGLGVHVPKRADFVGLNGDNPGSGASSNDSTLQRWREPVSGTYKEQRYSDQIYFVSPAASPASVEYPDRPKQSLCVLGYWIEDVSGDTSAPLTKNTAPQNSKDDTLRRCYRTDSGVAGPTDVWKAFDFTSDTLNSRFLSPELASSVKQLDIKYYDYVRTGSSPPRLEEYNAWDSLPGTDSTSNNGNKDDNKLPVAVKITITVADKNDIIKGLKLSTIVFLDNAGRR